MHIYRHNHIIDGVQILYSFLCKDLNKSRVEDSCPILADCSLQKGTLQGVCSNNTV